jgi:hypothetical protein
MPVPIRWYDHQRGLRQLAEAAAGAVAMRPARLAASVFGGACSVLPPYDAASEYRHVAYAGPRATLRYVLDVAIPSLPLPTPAWAPNVADVLFWHPSTIERIGDRYGHPASFPDEAWFFINGIMTSHSVARVNACYLAALFGRPITVIHNSTSGLLVDLAECVLGKAHFATTEAAKTALPAIHAALTDPTISRVVIVAHSQGTIIAANVLERLSQLHDGQVPPLGSSRYGLSTLSDDEVAKLEIYAFANCATRMPYIQRDARVPWIESFGNEWDLVARLGMLAPNKKGTGVHIDGPIYQRRDRTGHLLNEHYLLPIAAAQLRGQRRGSNGSPAPFDLLDAGETGVEESEAPRLFSYLNAGAPNARDGVSSRVGRASHLATA